MKTPPPRKREGQAKGPRRLNGELRDVATQAQALGISEKALRAKVARGTIPYRRDGGRIVFLAEEVSAFLHALPGVSVEEALQNVAARRGEEVGR